MKHALYLPIYEENALGDNRELLADLLGGLLTLDGIRAVCTNWRRAAIASLLQTARPHVLRQRLQCSGRAFVHWLSTSDTSELCGSDCTPFLDAAAAGDFETAAEIARASPRHASANEYEEDFLFHELLMQHVDSEASFDSSLLDRWEACLAGSDDSRLLVGRALVAGDAPALAVALVAWLDQRREDIYEARDQHEPEFLATEAAVSIAAVAVLRIARRRGVAVAVSHAQIPDLTLDATDERWDRESFRATL